MSVGVSTGTCFIIKVHPTSTMIRQGTWYTCTCSSPIRGKILWFRLNATKPYSCFLSLSFYWVTYNKMYDNILNFLNSCFFSQSSYRCLACSSWYSCEQLLLYMDSAKKNFAATFTWKSRRFHPLSLQFAIRSAYLRLFLLCVSSQFSSDDISNVIPKRRIR